MDRAVLFDLYGTLVDLRTDEDEPSLWQGLSDWLKANLGFQAATADDLRQDYATLIKENARVHGEGFILPKVFSQLLGPSATQEDIGSFADEFRRLSTKSLELRPYTIPLLTRLRQADGVRLGVVSNTEGLFTNYDIDRLGIRKFFDVIVLSSEVGVAKPDPEILNKSLRWLATRPDRAVFVGDTPETDLMAARALGMPCIIITGENRQPAGADQSVRFVRPALDDIYAELTRLLSTR
jgi:putative hydrolase of the HAD superfamily